MLIGKKINKKYGKKEVLGSIDIKIEPGKITALVGPSGGGKTTLLRSLSMIDPPNSGEIILDDVKYKFPFIKQEITPLPWPKISVVFQQLFLWPHLTLKENILLPLGKKDHSKHLNELIGIFNMRKFIDRYPNQVSLGQRQRAALARAIILNPKYLLLDEITSALDIEQVAAILKYLQVLKDRGMGILIVTHLLNFAQQASDQIIFLDEGRVLESGDKDILEKPRNERVKKFLSIVKIAT